MNRLSALAIAGLVSLGVAAVTGPASAETLASCRDNVVQDQGNPTETSSQIDSNAPAIMAALQQKGIDAQSISDWGGCVKADVRLKNGQVAMQFFDPDTLQRVHRG